MIRVTRYCSHPQLFGSKKKVKKMRGLYMHGSVGESGPPPPCDLCSVCVCVGVGVCVCRCWKDNAYGPVL